MTLAAASCASDIESQGTSTSALDPKHIPSHPQALGRQDFSERGQHPARRSGGHTLFPCERKDHPSFAARHEAGFTAPS
jgi:hypothetical protein